MLCAIKVLLVHDQASLEANVRAAFDQQRSQFELIGSETDYATAHRRMKQRFPDVVILGKRAGMLPFLHVLHSAIVTAQSLVFISKEDDPHMLWRAGATGICTDDIDATELHTALITVAGGNTWLSKSTAAQLLGERNGNSQRRLSNGAEKVVHGWQELSEREMTVLRLLANGARNREIAGELYTSISTIKSDIARILVKLGVDDRIEAAVYATRHGLI